jgi:spore coat protein U-like protein
MSKHVIAPIAAGILLALAGTAHAVTKQSTFQVSATVTENCVISAAPMDLGEFNGTNDLTASSAITVRCTSGTDFNVGLNAGLNGDFTNRVLTGPGGTELLYNLFTDAGRTIVWNDSTNRVGGLGAGMGTPRALTVYGQLLADLNDGEIDEGEYTDTITATVEY